MIANNKGEIPFVILFIPFLLGLCVGLDCLSVKWLIPLGIALLTLALVFVFFNIFYKRFNIYKTRWLGGVLINVILFLAGAVSIIGYNELNRKDHFSKVTAQYLVVNISNEPVLKNGLTRFTANVEQSVNDGKRQAVSGILLVTIKDSMAKGLNYGNQLLIPAKYAAVDPPFNPAEFNYKRYLAKKNIHYQEFLYPRQYGVIDHDNGNPIKAYALSLRRTLIEKIKINIHDPQAVAVASALILGYRADLSNDVLEAYSKTGTVYVLTVSGAQVAVIYLMLSICLKFLTHHKYGKLLRAGIIISILWYYALITGFSPAICRAVLMVSLIVIGKAYNRYINSLNILAISAFALLLYDPYLVTDVGFQLAYIAVTGLIIFRPVVYKWLQFKNKWADKIWQLCSLSIAAQLITFPLSAFYFHQFPVYFLVTNVFAFVPAAIIMYSGFIYLLLPQIPVVSKCLGMIIEKTILLMNKTLTVIEALPFASINKIWPTQLEYLLLYAIIISLFCYNYYKRPWLLMASLSCMLFLSLSLSFKRINSERLNSIAFLNPHKHIGLVMKNGNSAVVISDLSDTDKNYKYSVQPYLDSSQVTHVTVCNLSQNIHTAYLLKKNNLIQFMNKRILLYDNALGNLLTDEQFKTDYIYVTGNPYSAINSINKNYTCNLLVIDATNSNHFINLLEKQADTVKLNYLILKRNKSLVAVSKY